MELPRTQYSQEFRKERDKGVWGRLLEVLIDEPDYET